MKYNRSSPLATCLLCLLSFAFLTGNRSFAASYAVDNHIKVDQFGYRTADKKIAVISDPVTGYNSNSPFTPGNTYQLRRVSDDAVVYSGSPVAWGGGAVHSQSGDKVWWFDFTSFATVGSYYVFDVANNAGSYPFDINDCVYETVMKQAVRMFYYQRCGTAKAVPYAGTGWTDVACHRGALQDLDCRLYNDTSVATSRNLSGGWHDAGDYNKYVNFTFETVMDLLLAFEQNPNVWGDNYNIPESNNGVPDLLDEVKYELDWLLKMQQTNGGVLSVIGVQNSTSASPPSADHAQRFYGPATTSASFTAATLFALASIEFKTAGQSAYATTLQTAAVNAWNWATANPNITFNNAGIIAAGEQEVSAYGCSIRQIAASAFLFKLTGNALYRTCIDTGYLKVHLLQWGYAYPFENDAQDMLLYYASLPSAFPAVAGAIINAYTSSMISGNTDNLPAYLNGVDAYRAYVADQNYTWGSNTTKGRQGLMFTNMIYYNLDILNDSNYINAALGFVNYFHGVNPTAFCYLSNMGSFGAENSINEFYHSWFTDGSGLWDRVGVSTYGPPPGYVPGGPNPGYTVDGCCPSGCGSPSNNAQCDTTSLAPPLHQPIQKSYKDWNANWPQDSWTVTEPGIYTEASYVRLLSWFLKSSCIATSVNSYLPAKNLSLEVFPNPVSNIVTVVAQSDGVGTARMSIENVEGRIVYSTTKAVSSSTVSFEIETGNLSAGFYFVELETEAGKAVGRFVK